jgi:hypothetical protein
MISVSRLVGNVPESVEDILLIHASSYHEFRGKSSSRRMHTNNKKPRHRCRGFALLKPL